MIKILLVEDEDQIRKVLSFNLIDEGYAVVEAKDGKEAITFLQNEYFDLILLDLMLPLISGLDVLDFIKLEGKSIPTIILSAKNQTKDRIIGLKKGADDYITKPFDLEELLLRINNVVQRKKTTLSALNDIVQFGDNSVNLRSFQAHTNAGTIDLTKKEIAILKLLNNNHGEVVSRKEILQKVWGFDVYPNTRTIDNFLLAFRKYFEKDPKNPIHFHSIRGIGYKFIKNPN